MDITMVQGTMIPEVTTQGAVTKDIMTRDVMARNIQILAQICPVGEYPPKRGAVASARQGPLGRQDQPVQAVLAVRQQRPHMIQVGPQLIRPAKS
jgi:hypothetical protein